MWAKTFRDAFCGHFNCQPEQFEQRVLRRALHRRSLPIAGAFLLFKPNYFDMELRTLRYLGNARSSEEFRAELDSYRSEYRRHGGFLRNMFALRLSGRRLMDLAANLKHEFESGGTTSP
jgi:hypothetical protein